jgi:taurine dioxygenase
MNALERTPSGQALGARLTGLDLSQQVGNEVVEFVMRALGEHGVLCFPGQNLTAKQQRDFAAHFGELEINVANAYQEPGLPEVMILSNIMQDGRQIGMLDAGQDWHTDMSYNRMIALANVLYAVKVPQRNGRPLGATRFANMHQACQDLPEDIRQRLEGMTVTHDFNKFWDMMRRGKGSTRPPLTQAQREAKPPVSHPLLLRHPLTGRQVLYANPGYAVRITQQSPI